jgi:hypothetical protein
MIKAICIGALALFSALAHADLTDDNIMPGGMINHSFDNSNRRNDSYTTYFGRGNGSTGDQAQLANSVNNLVNIAFAVSTQYYTQYSTGSIAAFDKKRAEVIQIINQNLNPNDVAIMQMNNISYNLFLRRDNSQAVFYLIVSNLSQMGCVALSTSRETRFVNNGPANPNSCQNINQITFAYAL